MKYNFYHLYVVTYWMQYGGTSCLEDCLYDTEEAATAAMVDYQAKLGIPMDSKYKVMPLSEYISTVHRDAYHEGVASERDRVNY